MHAGFQLVAWIGFWNWGAALGGENLSGGDCANGIPRNWFTGPSAAGRLVDFPITTPLSIVAVGAALSDAKVNVENRPASKS